MNIFVVDHLCALRPVPVSGAIACRSLNYVPDRFPANFNGD